jgi:hypothetical protein
MLQAEVAAACVDLITQMTPRMARRGRRVVQEYHSSHGSQCHSVPEGALRARVPGALRDGSPVCKCVGPMAFVAHAARALLMDSFMDAGSGGISVGNAATKRQ